MTRDLVALIFAVALAGCESSGGGGNDLLGLPSAGSGTKKPGFADDIAKQIHGEKPDGSGKSGSAMAGSAMSGSAMAGSAGSTMAGSAMAGSSAGSAMAGSTMAGSAGASGSGSAMSGTAMAGSAKPDTTKPDTTKPDTTKPDTTKPDTTKPDTTKPDTTKPDTTKPDTTKPDTTKPDVATKPDTTKPDTTKPDTDTTKPDTTKPGATITRGGATAAMKLAPINPFELAKIKLQLRANWLRDTHGVATISFVLTEPSKGEKILFVFEYGYEVDTAPTDREEYKKWLATNKVLSNTMDRQRGVSWYLEGTDANGRGAFRYVAQFGAKKLICGGSLYRDSDSNRWGEYRDEIVGAAKQICETISL